MLALLRMHEKVSFCPEATWHEYMNKTEIVEDLGKAIIKRLHDYNEEVGFDDAEYIPIIKRTIEAIEGYIVNSEKEIEYSEDIKSVLFNYSKELYVELCIKHSVEDNEEASVDEVREESDEYFRYIYEHEEHPR